MDSVPQNGQINTTNPLLEEALTYASLCWPVIPLHTPLPDGGCSCNKLNCKSIGKHPRIPNWPKQATTNENIIMGWWHMWPDANIGIVTGEVSGLIVIDADIKEDGINGLDELDKLQLSHTELNKKTVALTGGGGKHILNKYPTGMMIKNKVGFGPGLDLRSNGGYIVAPPSLHESGHHYRWETFEPQNLKEPPGWLVDIIKQNYKDTDAKGNRSNSKKKKKKEAPIQNPKLAIHEGERNSTLASLSGSMRRRGMAEEEILAALLTVNENRCIPPLDENEVERIAKSIASYEPEEGGNKKDKPNIADILIILAQRSLCLFSDDLEKPFAQLRINGHTEIWPLNSDRLKGWLRYEYYRMESKSPSSEAVKQAIGVLEGLACYEGPRHKLNLRVASLDNALYYDLADENWRVVKITPAGWTILDDPPILFRRYYNTGPQVEPSGEIKDVFKLYQFLNLKSENEKILFLIHVITCFVPGIPHAVAVLHGEKGAAKSTVLRILRRLVDPAKEELLTLPRSDDLIITLNKNYLPTFDNLTKIDVWQSDIFCRAATGGAILKRKLYTDEDEIIISIHRCIGLNGINCVVNKPDLLDRSLIFELERIAPGNRREEAEFWSQFEEVRPKILGGVLSTLSKAMKIYHEITLPKLPRMADYFMWGCAVAEAIGIGSDAYIAAYEENVAKANQEVIASNPVADAVVALMQKQDFWEGTATELLNELKDIANNEGIDIHKDWPRAPNSLSSKLKEINSNLLDAGIIYERARENNNTRTKIISLKRPSRPSGSSDNS